MNRLELMRERLRITQEIVSRQAKKDFKTYCKLMWDVIEPANPFVDGWHIDAICTHLEAFTRFEIPKLIINVPPRHTKSILTGVMWPSWVWTTEPARRFIFSSYAQRLSTRDSVKTRTVIESPKYQEFFRPKWKLRDDQNEKMKFENTMSGFRFSTSVGGIVTGEGGDYIATDDPLNAIDAMSDPTREEVNRWWDEVMSTRTNNPNKVARLVIMQRLHEKDLTGHLEAKRSGYEVLRLPAEYDPKIISTPGLNFTDPRTEIGQLLWPEQFNNNSLQELKKDLGSRGANAQLQQNPMPSEGGMFKRKWWKYYKEVPHDLQKVVQFWDCAQKDKKENDFSVCATWGKTKDGYYLLGLTRLKLEMPDLERAAVNNFNKMVGYGHPPSAVVIEDKSGGSSLIQYLKRETKLPVIAYDPGQRSKVVRADAATPTVEAGKCFLPDGAPWLEDFISEHERFPLVENDDQVDTTSMMRDYFVNLEKEATLRVRTL